MIADHLSFTGNMKRIERLSKRIEAKIFLKARTDTPVVCSDFLSASYTSRAKV